MMEEKKMKKILEAMLGTSKTDDRSAKNFYVHDQVIQGYTTPLTNLRGHAQLITHTDLDGYAAGAIVVEAIADNLYNGNKGAVNVFHSDYATHPTLDNTADVIVITDYCFQNLEMGEEIDNAIKCGTPVIYIDHHESGIKNMEFLSKESGMDFLSTLPGIRSKDYCGTMLAWAYFHPGEVIPEFVDLVDDWDCWKLKDPRSKALNMAFSNMEDGPDGWDKDIKSSHWEELLHGVIDLYHPDRHVNERMARYVDYGVHFDQYIRDHRRSVLMEEGFVATLYDSHNLTTDGAPVKALVLVTPDHSSLVFGDLLTTDKQKGAFDYGLIIHDNGNSCTASIYCRGDLTPNARQICELYGGGGHNGAAGFQWSKIDRPDFLPYNPRSVKSLVDYLK